MDLLKIATDAQEAQELNYPRNLGKAWAHYANSVDQSHGTKHIETVFNNAMALANHYPKLNRQDVHYAAVLHDIGREDDVVNGTDNHEIHGTESAKAYIAHLPTERQELILDAIRNHRSTTGKPSTLLAKLISDSDRIPSSIMQDVERIHDYRKSKGYSDEEALRTGYWYLRHKRFKKIDSRVNSGLYLPESRELMSSKIQSIKNKTQTFSDYQKLLGFDGSIPFK